MSQAPEFINTEPCPVHLIETSLPARFRCIKPHCPETCGQCSRAIPTSDEARVLLADVLDALAIDGFEGPLEEGESAIVDRARAWLAALQPSVKPLDDPRLQQLFGDAIEGALALGFQNSNPPPPGHWLQRFWDIGRAEALRAGEDEPTTLAEALDKISRLKSVIAIQRNSLNWRFNRIQDLQVALAQPATVQPEGWVMVPLEPTTEMLKAGGATPGMRAIDSASMIDQLRGNPLDPRAFEAGAPLAQAYRAMLAAAHQSTSPHLACDAPPAGWHCTRAKGHEGPCAATPATEGGPA